MTASNASAMVQHFFPSGTRDLWHGDALTPRLRDDALAALGVGLMHRHRESVLAVGIDDFGKDLKYDFFAVTDRRVLRRKGKHTHVIGFDQLQDLRLHIGVVRQKCEALGPQGWIHLTGAPTAEHLGGLLQAMQTLAPSDRVPWSSPLGGTASDGDPAGARSAAEALGRQTPQTMALLQGVYQLVAEHGVATPVAAEWVARILLAHRTRLDGRGMEQGAWLSALTPPDFDAALTRAFGSPTAVEANGPSVRATYVLKGEMKVGKAAASTAVGLTVLAVTGIGWVSRPGNPNITFRVTRWPTPASTSYTVEVSDGAFKAPHLTERFRSFTAAIHDTLLGFEGLLTAARVIFGPNAPAHDLLAKTVGAYDEAAVALIGRPIPGVG